MKYAFAFLLILFAETVFVIAFVICGMCVGIRSLARMIMLQNFQD